MAALGIYVHVPFCSRRCSYCDFFVVTGAGGPLERRLARALVADLDLAAQHGLAGEPADTLYFGGGTPSRLRPEELGACVDAVRRLFDWRDSAAEVTLEANPEDLDEERLAAFLGRGVDRLSIGVQTLDEAALRALGRLHGEAEVHAAALAARRAGFANLSFDLICGLPGLGVRTWLEALERLLGHEPQHLSIYMLDMDKHTPLRQAVEAGRDALPEESVVLEAFAGAAEALEAAGYERYEISNFARPGFGSRHNLKYWRDVPFLGVGPSAWSYLEGRRFRRVADLPRYLAGVESGAMPCDPPGEHDGLDAERRLAEAIVLGLRLREGVDLAACGTPYGRDAWGLFGERVRRLEAEGWLDTSGGRVRLTRAALPVANEIWEQFLPG
jgi:oxygen-independent coproporphyrinogen-3 oxidase